MWLFKTKREKEVAKIEKKYGIRKQVFKEFFGRNNYDFWANIVKKEDLPTWFLIKYHEYLDWDLVTKHQILTEETIEELTHLISVLVNERIMFGTKYFNLNPYNMAVYQRLSEKSIELLHQYGYIYWTQVSKHQRLSENFMRKYDIYLDWTEISINQCLSEKFIEEYADRINWTAISVHQNLSESFIEKHADKINWTYISDFQEIPENLAVKFNDRLYYYNKPQNFSGLYLMTKANGNKPKMRGIYCINNYSLDFVENNQRKYDWERIVTENILTEEFIEKFKKILIYKKVRCLDQYTVNTLDKYNEYLDWDEVSRLSWLTTDFIDKYINVLNWNILSSHINLTKEFLFRYYNNIKLPAIFYNKTFTPDMLDVVANKIANWSNVIANNFMPESFLHKYIKEFEEEDISLLLRKQKLSETFLREHFDKLSKTNINTLLQTQKLSESFIHDFHTKMSWCDIINTQKLSKKMLKTNARFYCKTITNFVYIQDSKTREMAIKFCNKFYNRF